MTDNKFFRVAGWVTLVSALLMLAAFVSFPLGAGMVGGVLEILGLLGLIFVFYALNVAHRSQAKGLSRQVSSWGLPLLRWTCTPWSTTDLLFSPTCGTYYFHCLS